MSAPQPIIKDPMKHDPAGRKNDAEEFCCYVWFGRKWRKKKLKPQPTEGIPNTDSRRFDVSNFINKKE